MFAGLGCSLIFPVLTMIAVGSFYGSPLMYVNLASVQDDLVLFAILTFTCFWCACAANGTVRAAVCAVPISAAAALAAAAGLWLGRSTARTTGTLSDLVISSFHLSPMLFTSITESARRTVLWMFVPALFLALIQSYWLFDAPPRNGVRWMLRCALPLVAITVVWVFLGSVGFLSSQWLPLDETGQALNSLEPRVGNAELRGDDLAKSSHLSALTRRWLKGSRLTVAALPSKSSAYLVTIHLASDRECTLTVARSGGTAALCGN